MNSSVDPQALAALRELNPEDPGFLGELITVFLEDVPLRIAEVEKALATSDASLLTRAAHTIKGSCSNFGAASLAAVSLEMEKQGKTGAFAEAAASLPKLKAEFDQVAKDLQQYR